MKVIDPELDIIDEAIMFIMRNGITAHCAAIGTKKVINKLKKGFEDGGYASSIKDNSIFLYSRQRELGKITPMAKVNITDRDINFEWNTEEKFNPLYIIGIALKEFYSEFGELNDAIIELESEENIYVYPLISDDFN